MIQKIVAIIFTLLMLVHYPSARAETAKESPQPEVKAFFLNVGKADAALFSLDGKWFLVDTGTKDSADMMIGMLENYGVKQLDGILITHTDKDHVGGLKPLLKSGMPVAMLFAPTFSVDSVEDHPVWIAAEKYEVPFRWLNAGDTVTVDNAISFAVLGPISRDEETENNNSLVLRLKTPQGDMLLAGDMELTEEKELLAAGVVQPAAVLKVGHHGADDASGEPFLYTVKPQIAVISTDPEEDDRTPDPKVIRRLWNIGAEVYSTYQAGCCVEVTLRDGNAVGRLVNDPAR